MTAENGQTNKVLAALSRIDPVCVERHTKLVQLGDGDVLYEPGDDITNLYFPETAIISLQVVWEDGLAIEAANTGTEGVVGLGGLLSGDVSFSRQLVQVAGSARILSRRWFLDAMQDNPEMRALFAAHADAFVAQILQSAACNATHSVEERFARWLLTCLDRLPSVPEIPMTHEIFASMLGVRRPTVTLVARTLQSAGLISYRRGKVRIIDQTGLKDLTCSCYETIKTNYDRMFSQKFR